MRTIIGKVVSLKTPQTAQVLVTRQWQHPLYKKSVKRSKKYACHVSELELAMGDKVEIAECAPISATKRFKVVSKIAIKAS